MPKFEVGLTFGTTLFVTVEADDTESAGEKAENDFDLNDHHEEIQYGYWSATEVFEIGEEETGETETAE